MKLNRKGYLTVEIILASTIAFAIAFFLIEITVKLVSKTDDVYHETVIAYDDAIIINNNGIFTYKAILDITPPNSNEPVSPINTFAGYALNPKNPKQAPAVAAASAITGKISGPEELGL